MATRPVGIILRRFCLQSFVFVAAVLSGSVAAGPVHADYSSAQLALFDTPHLANVSRPTRLHYDFSHSGSGEAIKDRVDVVITEILPDGRKNLEFDFLTGSRHIDFPPIESFRGNPLIMLFLEHDVKGMSAETGGATLYFRNRFRAAFRERARAETVSFDFDGRRVTGTRVVVSPFVEDPRLVAFPPLDQKTYEFLLSSEVPGGIYEIRATTPAGPDEAAVEDSVRFREAAPL